MPERVTTLYRPVGRKELDLIRASGFRAFPPRLPSQPFFYPVLNEEYAVQIARDWNTKDEASGYEGYVLSFDVRTEFLNRYEVHVVGHSKHESTGFRGPSWMSSIRGLRRNRIAAGIFGGEVKPLRDE